MVRLTAALRPQAQGGLHARPPSGSSKQPGYPAQRQESSPRGSRPPIVARASHRLAGLLGARLPREGLCAGRTCSQAIGKGRQGPAHRRRRPPPPCVRRFWNPRATAAHANLLSLHLPCCSRSCRCPSACMAWATSRCPPCWLAWPHPLPMVRLQPSLSHAIGGSTWQTVQHC